MADPNMNKTPNTDTMQREQAKAGAAGDHKPEDSKLDSDRREQDRLDKERREKGAIGGGEAKSPTGQSPSGQSDQNRELDKTRTEPASR